MDDDTDDFVPPNGSAYEKKELRQGPPLSYVAEKLERSLACLHEQLAETPVEQRPPAMVAALQYGATAFLALHNMLGLAHADDWFARIEGMTRTEFRAWLARVSASGAVTG